MTNCDKPKPQKSQLYRSRYRSNFSKHGETSRPGDKLRPPPSFYVIMTSQWKCLVTDSTFPETVFTLTLRLSLRDRKHVVFCVHPPFCTLWEITVRFWKHKMDNDDSVSKIRKMENGESSVNNGELPRNGESDCENITVRDPRNDTCESKVVGAQKSFDVKPEGIDRGRQLSQNVNCANVDPISKIS
ncbi:hypothetical protein CEXT_239581 [Caerostris extrusa]|uniref:Uncharacterized protein n=1 Tax=Caerostris extrusa TaxID=172846 RepID=A0AAV4UMY9_CAEEX|nr:hypothetical protein CEXT_239581 [Caerostris extrusa]